MERACCVVLTCNVIAWHTTRTRSYMKMKQQACRAVGFTSSVVELEADTSQDALSRKINQHTTDASVDGTTPSLSMQALGDAGADRNGAGVIVQLPLPEHINPQMVPHPCLCLKPHHHHHSSSSSIGHRCHWRGQGRGRAAPYERRRVCAGNVSVWRMCCVVRLTNVVVDGGG